MQTSGAYAAVRIGSDEQTRKPGSFPAPRRPYAELSSVMVELVDSGELGERAILREAHVGSARAGASPNPFSRDLGLEITTRYGQIFRSFHFYPVVVNVRMNLFGSDPRATRLGELFRNGPLNLPPKRDSGFEASMRPGCITMAKISGFLVEERTHYGRERG